MKRISFLVGPNGCGKTRALVEMAKTGIANNRRSISIANTPFVRFPHSRDKFRVFRVTPTGINRIVAQNLNKLFSSESGDTFDISDLLGTIGFHPNVQLEIKLHYYHEEELHEYLDGIEATRYEFDAIYSALEIIRSKGRASGLDLSKSSDSFTRSMQERNRVILKFINELKSRGVVSSYNLIFHHIERGPQRFKELSSGEQTLISTHLFVKSNSNRINTIFIDEPENSLHPEWQRRYVEMLHMALGYNEVKIILATHSPILVSGSLSNYGQDVEVIKIEDGKQSTLDINQYKSSESVEEILWEVFDTITPVSHFLSIELSRILQAVTDGEFTQEEARIQIEEFQTQSYDKKQKKLLGVVLERLSGFVTDA